MAFRALVPRHRATRPAWPAWHGLFDELWRDVGIAPSGSFSPSIDVEETDDEIRLVAELPGLEEKDFDLTLEGDVLTLKGEKRVENEEKREGYHRVERSSGSFHRAFRLPFEVNGDNVKATYKNGVLTVAIAKPTEEQVKTRTIPVTAS